MSRLLVFALVVACCFANAAAYKLGVGIADVTGPTVEVPFMGYAMGDQKGAGLHLRLKARAFVFADDQQTNTVAYVSADLCMIFQGVKEHVVQMLQQKFGSLYSTSNVLLTGTHTHGAPGGFSSNTLYAITVLGFQQENFDAIVNGIFTAIADATLRMQASAPGATLTMNTGILLDSNINRSPSAYLANPQFERDWYDYDVDKNMTTLRLQDAQGHDIGLASWFAVHGTSMDNRNLLVSSDNKGFSSMLFEKFMNGIDSRVGAGPYVSSIAQTNSGDVSPRTRGAFCPDGTPCERIHSTCNGKNEGCNGIGPGNDEFESTQIISAHQMRAAAQVAGFNVDAVDDFLAVYCPVPLSDRVAVNSTRNAALKQSRKANQAKSLISDNFSEVFREMLGDHVDAQLAIRALADIHSRVSNQSVILPDPGFEGPVQLSGPVGAIHAYLDMHAFVVNSEYSGTGQNQPLCHAAMGDSFAAGTTDGNGELSFIQGENSTTSNPFWNMLAHLLAEPTATEIACQAPKPILFNTGDISWPTPWTQQILPFQMLRIGNLFLVGPPAELTTMAGRRLRASTAAALRAAGVENPIVVISSIANAYSGYITTFEEFQMQRYEGASTIFGPFEFNAYQQEFATLAAALATGGSVPAGPNPPNLDGKMPNLLAGVVFDSTPIGKSFGDVSSDAQASYSISANSTVNVTFWGADLRNQFETVQTYLTVEKQNSDGSWTVMFDDADWETRLHWARVSVSESAVTVEFKVPQYATPGAYRIRHFGVSKNLLGKFSNYQGTSRTFNLTA